MVHYFLNLFLTKNMLYLVHTYVGERGFPGIIKFFPFFFHIKRTLFPLIIVVPPSISRAPNLFPLFQPPSFFLFFMKYQAKVFNRVALTKKNSPNSLIKLANSFFKKKFISSLVVNLEKIYYFCKDRQK